MHDPHTVAFTIKRPWKTPRGYRPDLLVIWHVDPERDGTDDSCGWFKRARHGDPAMRETIRREFRFMWTWGKANQGWFDADTDAPTRSVPAIVLDMVYTAARRVLAGRGDRYGWRRAGRFLQAHLFEVLQLAEGGTDNLSDFVTNRYGSDREERIDRATDIVYGWILRARQPWYRHPRWHVHHWRLQCPPLQQFQRWAFSRCAGCGQRFPYGYAPMAGWGSTGPRWFRSEPGVYHHECFPQKTRPFDADPRTEAEADPAADAPAAAQLADEE